MFYVYCDGTEIYDLNADGLMILDPVLDLELNQPGTFEFIMPPEHPYYDLPQKMISRIWVIQDDTEIFRGRIIEESVDFYKQKTIYCEGELAFLNDSIQRPAEYHDISVRDYFKALIECHNEQVEEDKQFEIGIVTISDENDSIFRYTNYNATMTEMKEDLVDDFGGYIRVRNENGHRYLDYIDIDTYGARVDNAIRFGTNLLDYAEDADASDIATVIIPLGEKLEESPIEALDMRLTIESVNGGSDAIESQEAVKTYGRIAKTVIWDDVTVASNLLEKGKEYLSDYQFNNMVLEVTAVDQHLIDSNIDSVHLGDMLRVISTPHGLDRFFPLSQVTIHLDSLDQNTFTLGEKVSEKTLSSKVASTTTTIDEVSESITPTQSILNQAKEQATNLITAATHGHVVMQPNSSPQEILIMDTEDTSTAKRLWRWNLNGLGYSSSGYNGTYGTAMTMDGAIVADYITTGTLIADLIKTGRLQDVKGTNYWDMDSGTLVINTKQLKLDSSGNATFSGALSAATGSFSGSLSAATGTFYGALTNTSGNYKTVITNGRIRIYYNDTLYGTLQPITSSGNPTYLSLLADSDGAQAISIGVGATGYLFVNNGANPNNYDERVQVWGTLRVTGRINGTYLNLAGAGYSSEGWAETSDETLKNDIKPLSANTETFLDKLTPVSFSFKDDDGQKIHFGLTYQNVREALEAEGIDPDESGLVTTVPDNEGEDKGFLFYDELIAPIIYEVKALKAEVASLKEEMRELKAQT